MNGHIFVVPISSTIEPAIRAADDDTSIILPRISTTCSNFYHVIYTSWINMNREVGIVFGNVDCKINRGTLIGIRLGQGSAEDSRSDSTSGNYSVRVSSEAVTAYVCHYHIYIRRTNEWNIGGLALCQHNLVLVGTVGRLRPHGQLESLWHTAGRTHNPVPAVTLVELRTFAGTVLRAVAIKHDDGLSDWSHAVSTHLTNGQHGGILRTTVGPSVYQIAASVLVPQRTGVDIALALDDTHGVLPFSCRILGLHHHHTKVGIAPIDIVPAIVIADTGCPYTGTMLGLTAEMGQERVIALVEVA